MFPLDPSLLATAIPYQVGHCNTPGNTSMLSTSLKNLKEIKETSSQVLKFLPHINDK
jgi:hypothetical protein